MGSSSSIISSLSSQEVAALVTGLGKAFQKYDEGIIDNRIHGSSIVKFSDDAIADCFEDVGVKSKAHRTIIVDHNFQLTISPYNNRSFEFI